MNHQSTRFILALIFILNTTVALGQTDPEMDKTLDAVSPEAIKATMTYLASDQLQGRQPGTKGFALASKYVEDQFKAMGLLPGVGGKSYVQKVPLRKAVVDETGSSFTLVINGKKQKLILGTDFMLNPYFVTTESEIKAPLAYVGYGVTIPDYGYDDYEEVDVKGKIVVFVNGAPSMLPSDERAYYSSASTKLAEAINHGAVGAISFSLPTDSRTSWDASVRRVRQGSFKWLDAKGNPANANDQLKAVVNFNPTLAEKLFAGAKDKLPTLIENLELGQAGVTSLHAEGHIKIKSKHSFVEGSNLIGVFPGSGKVNNPEDSLMKSEYIVYAAHLDHFGIGTPVKGDSIYNGAHDNASGVAILLNIAQAFRSYPWVRSRSVIFAVVTGEESGLLGSDYFVNNPTVPIDKIVANLSIDMPFFFHPMLDIVPYGADHSNLSSQVESAAGYLNLKTSPDPFPEQVVFIRSDHYSFIKKGIPSLFIKSGFMTVKEDLVDRSKTDVGWRSTIYHTPQDDMSQAFDFNAAAMHVKVNWLIGLMICGDLRPQWKSGDFFGKKFGKQ